MKTETDKIKIYESVEDCNDNCKDTLYRYQCENSRVKNYKSKGSCVGICKRLINSDNGDWTDTSFDCFHIINDSQGIWGECRPGWKIYFS